MKIYLVGGAVRDKLLDIPVKDHDWVVVGATPAEMRGRGYRQVGRDFPVFIDPDSGEEYALARTERKSGRGHAGFTVFASPEVTLEEDLQRRDLSINAMAEDSDGVLVDPYGGRGDIERRLLRHVSPAFAEDPLRVLRVARFAARFAHLGFRVADETLALMTSMSREGELADLAPERVWQEIQRALGEASPSAFIQVLRDCGALGEILPEVEALFGVPQPEKYHPEIDTGVHTLMALEQAARLTPDPVARFAALAHDLGKAATPPRHWPSHTGHEALGAGLADALCDRLRAPNEYRALARLVSLRHTDCHRALGQDAGALLDILESADAFRRPERFERFLLACEADARGRKGLEQEPYPQAGRLRAALAAAAAIDPGRILAEGLRGPEIGARLRELRIGAIGEATGS